jgi:hypothetical protein
MGQKLKTPLELRNALIRARDAYYRGEGSETAMLKAAEAYREAIRQYAKKNPDKTIRVPAIGYLIRAL